MGNSIFQQHMNKMVVCPQKFVILNFTFLDSNKKIGC